MNRVSQSAGVLAGVLMLGAPAFATPFTFAGYVQANSNRDFSLPASLGPGMFSVHIAGSGLVNFTYLVVGTPFDGAAQSAVLSFDATSTFTGNCASGVGRNCTQNDDMYTETGFSGSFSIDSTAPLLGLFGLLSGHLNISPPADPNRTASGGKANSTIGGTGGASDASQTATNPNQVEFASDFLDSTGTRLQEASFSFSSPASLFPVQGSNGNAGGLPDKLGASGSGTSSSPVAAAASVPEPSPLFLIGTALLLLAIGIRRKLV